MGGICQEIDRRVARIRLIRTQSQSFLDSYISTVIQATILLNANLAFLTVPNSIVESTDGGGSPPSTGVSFAPQDQPVSPAAILSYCSMLTSFGSIIMGLLLIRQHRGEEVVDNPRTVRRMFVSC